MSRVPSWAEICRVVEELSKAQRECYNSVHHLLDVDVPELDGKMRYLMSKPIEIPLTIASTSQKPVDPVHIHTQMTQTEPTKASNITRVTIKKDIAPSAATTSNIHAGILTSASMEVETIPIQASNNKVTPALKKSHTIGSLVNHPQVAQPVIVEAAIPDRTRKSHHRRQHHQNGVPTNGVKNSVCKTTSLKDLEQLRAYSPRLPLCEYLKRNRPDILMNVEARSSYIKKISLERKSQRAYRIMSSLERIRISSGRHRRKDSHQGQNRQTSNILPSRPRSMKDLEAPDYCVRHKQSEREMKQLTLRNYRRLPEVKKQKLEEINKHLKEQYYKNRQLYGRMLLNNFKNGIINYPLRASYDDRSLTSSQSEYSMSQSADTACSLEPY